MASIDEGNNGRIYKTVFGVQKIQKRRSSGHDIVTQRRIHGLAYTVAESLNLDCLFIPRVSSNVGIYEMEFIDTSKVIYLGDPVNSTGRMDMELRSLVHEEVKDLWLALWERGFAAWDFELFLQPDGRVALIDFDKFGFRQTGPIDVILLPNLGIKTAFTLTTFFQNACFPPRFLADLEAAGFSSKIA
jgi:hypothetical protein